MAVYAAGSATKRKALVSPPLDRLLATGTTSWGSITLGTLELASGRGNGNAKKASSGDASSSSSKRDIAAGADPNHYSSSITVPLSNLRTAAGLGSALSLRRRGGAGGAAAGGAEGESIESSTSGPPRARAVARARGVALFYSDALDATPPVLAHLIARVPCLFECNIFLTNRIVPVAEVPSSERLLARSQNVEGFFSVVARYGYMERIRQDEPFASGVVSFVLGRLGRKVCRAAGADDGLREALGLPRERFARALASDLGLELDETGNGNGKATDIVPGAASASLASLLQAPKSRSSNSRGNNATTTVASVADAFADAEAAEAADREREERRRREAEAGVPAAGLETVVGESRRQRLRFLLLLLLNNSSNSRCCRRRTRESARCACCGARSSARGAPCSRAAPTRNPRLLPPPLPPLPLPRFRTPSSPSATRPLPRPSPSAACSSTPPGRPRSSSSWPRRSPTWRRSRALCPF